MEGRLRNSRKIEAMGTFASGMLHNFYNLLMDVQGKATLALAHLHSSSLAVQYIQNIEKLVQNGATLAYGIIKSYNGSISVASEYKKATTFSIRLPSADDPTASAAPGNAPETDSMKRTLLMIDDDIMVIEPVSELLEQLGYNVLTALNGADALKMYRENWKTIDLVILDLVLPDANGGDLYEELRQINPLVKALISSGMGASNIARALLESGCLDYIQKPYDIRLLAAKIVKILSMP